jgi:hypothetical protein
MAGEFTSLAETVILFDPLPGKHHLPAPASQTEKSCEKVLTDWKLAV